MGSLPASFAPGFKTNGRELDYNGDTNARVIKGSRETKDDLPAGSLLPACIQGGCRLRGITFSKNLERKPKRGKDFLRTVFVDFGELCVVTCCDVDGPPKRTFACRLYGAHVPRGYQQQTLAHNVVKRFEWRRRRRWHRVAWRPIALLKAIIGPVP